MESILMGNTFDELFAEIVAEAEAEGPEAVQDLRAKQVRYALINLLISRRRQLHLTQAQLAERTGFRVHAHAFRHTFATVATKLG